MSCPALILASTSRYRRELLTRLQIPFETLAPNVDEQPFPGEAAEALVARLASAKAQNVAARRPDALVIGSDQVAVYDGRIVGKPGDREQACAQLARISGKTAILYTGLALVHQRSGREHCEVVPFRVVFRTLTSAQISAYLDREPAYDCAGSVRSEGLGIALFERFEGEDPTALMGLPLMRLVSLLEYFGCPVLPAHP
ncbi:MAG TPA: nucleoside triphosphate pyrophosphatase [Acidiferrobacteraceae bacterium]|nr:nucleoside triphosphate pyrophosphatase [Acidiferrobacteraceae bacterium]